MSSKNTFLCILIRSRINTHVIIWGVNCFVAGVFKVYFVIRNYYVIIILRCYNKNIVNLHLLNWFLLQYLYYNKCIHKFWLLIGLLVTPMYVWWSWSRRWETKSDHHQTFKTPVVTCSSPNLKIIQRLRNIQTVKICEPVIRWRNYLFNWIHHKYYLNTLLE